MSLRATTGNVDDYGRTHEFEIYDSAWGGGVTALKNTGEGYASFDHEVIDPRKPWENPIQKGALELSVWLQDSTLIDDIKAADEQQFEVIHYIDSVQEWQGYVYNDLTTYEEGFDGHPFRITLMVKDFTDLGGKDYLVSGALPDSREQVIQTIAYLLNEVGFDIPIRTHTNWIEEHITASQDYLRQIYHETKALRVFGRTGDEEPQPITVEDALTKLLSNHKLILKQTNGAYYLDQLTALDDPTSVLEAEYDLTGALQSESTGNDLTVDANTSDLKVVISEDNRDNSGLPGLKRAKVKFDHRNRISGILFPEEVEFTDSDSQDFSEPFISDGNQTIEITGLVRALMRTGATDASADLDIRIERTGADDYYLDETGDNWITTGTGFAPLELVDMGGDVWQRSFDIITPETPADADGVLSITINSATASNTMPAVAHTTFWRDLALEIRNINNSTHSNFQLTQTGGFSVVTEFASTWYGDGPNSASVSALRYGTGDTEITSTSWQFRGSTAYRDFHENHLKESMDLQRKWRRLLSALLKGKYNPHQVLNYDGVYFYYLGGSQDIFTGNWNVEIFNLNAETGSDSFEEILRYTDEDSSTGSTGGGGTSTGGGLTETEADGLYFNELNNLSEGDPTTIRANIGVEIGSDVQAWSSVLDSVAANDGSAALDLNSLTSVSDIRIETGIQEDIGLRIINSQRSWRIYANEPDDTLTFRDATSATDFIMLSGGTGAVDILGPTNIQDTLTGVDADFSSSLEANTLRTDTGKFLAPVSYQFRNAGDTAFRDVEMADLYLNTDLYIGGQRSATAGSGIVYFGDLDGGDGSRDLQLRAGGTDIARLLPNGNFGIGTTTPGSLLDVDGTFTASGLSTFTGNIDAVGSNEWRFYDIEPTWTSGTGFGIQSIHTGTGNIFEVWNGAGEKVLGIQGDKTSIFEGDVFLETLAGSSSYVSGIFGAGTRWDTAGSTFFEIDNMRVRNELRAHIFKKDIVRASNGYLLITDSAQIGENKTLADNTAGQTLDIDAGDGNATFSVGDLVWAKNIRDDGSLVINGLKAEVTAIDTSDPDVTVLTLDTTGGNGGEVFDGDTIVRVSGGYLMNDASSEFSPFLDVYDGVNTWSDFQSADKLKGRYGNLNGLTIDTVSLTGYGLYSNNVYLTGSILVGDLTETSNYLSFDGTSLAIDSDIFDLTANNLRISNIDDGLVQVGLGAGGKVGLTGASSGSGGEDSVAFWAGDSFSNRTTAPIWFKRGGDFNLADGAITGTPTSASIDVDDLFVEAGGTGFESADFYLNSTAHRLSLGSVFSADGSTNEVGLSGFTADLDSIYQVSSGVEAAMGFPNLYSSAVLGFHVGVDTSNRIFMGELSAGDYEFRVIESGNFYFRAGTIANQIAGFAFNSTQLESTNLSGGGDGSFTTDGILINSGGYISAPNFYLSSTGAGALGDLDLSGDLSMLTGGEMSDGSTWRISGDSGFDFQGGESGINKIEWRDGDFDNNTLLMGELYAYHDSANDETNFVMRAQNTVASTSRILLTATELQVNADAFFQRDVEFENTIQVNYAPGAIVDGYFSFGANDNGTSGRMRVPHFTSTSRPSTANTGEIIYNTTINQFQGWDGSAWKDITQ